MAERASDVAVIGGGPAGLQAARSAADAGARVLIVEREERLGGILKQCVHDGFGVMEYGERLTGPEYACRDIAAIKNRDIPYETSAFVHSLARDGNAWTITLVTPRGGVEELRCRSVIMATGCRERTDRQVFLQGDRPAGIFTAGQAQRLININGVLPGKRVVILGSGDIGLIMARRFTLEGAAVLGIYEIKDAPSGLTRNIAQCVEDWSIPLHLKTTVTKIHGRDRVEAVTVCPVDANGRPDLDRGCRVACDTLVLSVGLIPEDDILWGLGLAMDERTRGPFVNQHRETAMPGLYVCGNALHVYDLVDYVSECGRTAGQSAARYCAGPAGAARPPGLLLQAADELLYQVPQYVDPGAVEPPAFFYRVRRAMERAVLTISVEERELESRPLRYCRPQEMERYEMAPATWEGMRSARCPVRLSVQEVRHG